MHQLAEIARKGEFSAAQALHQAGKFLGIFSHSLNSWKDLAGIGRAAGELLADEDRKQIEASIAARNAARKAKNFKELDRIRDELAAMGVVLKDNKDGTTTWEVAR